ncbi:MAG: ABC transporter permease subunit [Pseudohongiellaceae bacterium]
MSSNPSDSNNSQTAAAPSKPVGGSNSGGLPDSSSPRLALRRKLRHLYDRIAKVCIGIGGVSVIAAILLIFIYLLYEVVPLFARAEVRQVQEYALAERSAATTLLMAIDEQSEIGMRLSADGEAHFFNLQDGGTVSRLTVPVPDGASVVSFALDAEDTGHFALGLDNGEAVVARYGYDITFELGSNARIISPLLEYPFGEEPYTLAPGAPLSGVAIRTDGQNLILAGASGAGDINLLQASRQTNLFSAFDGGDGGSFAIETASLSSQIGDISELFIDNDRRWLFLISATGLLRMFDLQAVLQGGASASTMLIDEVSLAIGTARPTDIAFLLGGVSLLVADSGGHINQWFVVNNDGRAELQRIRSFASLANPATPTSAAISDLTAEQRRKNFVTADAGGNVAIYNTTSHREVFSGQLLTAAPQALAISPRGDNMLAETTDGRITVWEIHNEHPEVSWSALWSRVWYEGYGEPEFIWQSSSATNDFEPKYSLMPLSFGTLKAAFYAMLLATPLAICGAVFTGYFMAPAMRRKIKPLIELMEALPTVVLGFLAGLWLAPFVELNLLGIFSILIILPVSMLLASFIWFQLPKQIRHQVPDGWEAAILLPVVLFFGWLSFALATPLEGLLFGGDMRFWISNELGIGYDQRNALVVGFAMGFAVIPTIFSIAEDAIFTVPKHLTYGSLALGATPWQSLYRVVLPTASPGIFSGLMIGMGRAVGETMIVLMATGNTPVMDINIFEGMRTLAANIAVEIPESEVDSTHYRILFLAALVLFMFTFAVNTVAEIVRQRLRIKYSTI